MLKMQQHGITTAFGTQLMLNKGKLVGKSRLLGFMDTHQLLGRPGFARIAESIVDV